MYDKKMLNGISCDFIESNMDMCYVSLVIRNGSLKDGKKFGVAHFLEHMLMQIDYESKGVGPDFFCVGTTSFDYTKYVISADNKIQNILIAIRIIFEIFNGIQLISDNLEKVRKDIINEYRMMSKSPFFKLYSIFIKELGISDYLPIGNLQDIESITYKDLIENFKREYNTSNAHIIILGGKKDWANKIWNVAIEKNFETDHLPNNLEVKNSPDRRPSNLEDEFTVIFLKSHVECEDIVYSELIESMALTFLEELYKEEGNIPENAITLDIFQPIKSIRYIRIIVSKELNFTFIIHVYKKVLTRIKCNNNIHQSLVNLINEYIKMLKKNEYGYQYIYHLVDAYIFDKKPYTNGELMKYIKSSERNLLGDIVNFAASSLKKPVYYIYYLKGGEISAI